MSEAEASCKSFQNSCVLSRFHPRCHLDRRPGREGCTLPLTVNAGDIVKVSP